MIVHVGLIKNEWPPLLGVQPGNERFDAIVDSIRKDGIRDPLTIKLDWTLIDGCHRLFAARLLGIEHVPVRVWTGTEFLE